MPTHGPILDGDIAEVDRLRAINAKLIQCLEGEHEALGCETEVTHEPCSTCALIKKAKA